MIANKRTTMELLAKYQLVAKKNYGQNFLINEQVAQAIAFHPSIDSNTVVIEIGPGLGALTELILPRCAHFVAYEIDQAMIKPLQDQFSHNPHFELHHQDFLTVKLEELVERFRLYSIVVVSNLPYYITSDLLLHLFTIQLPIKGCLVMMQKEVAQRIIKSKGGKEENELTLLSKYYTEVTKIKEVSKNDFIPRPHVDSTILGFMFRQERRGTHEEEAYLLVVKTAFKNRRKTIGNNLAVLFQDKKEALAILEKAQINPDARAETLSIEDFIRLSQYF